MHSFRKLSTFAIFMAVFFTVQAQNSNSSTYLQQAFPKLTKLYSTELSDCHTHYIFAVDVSGSMFKYDTIVTPALQAFVQALPIGEQVSVIPFGTETREIAPGLCAKIQDESQKQTLITALSDLYVNEGYSKEFRHNTDVKKAIEAVNNAILNNQEVQMNVVVIITDFLNDLPNVGEKKLSKVDLEKLNKDFGNVTENTYTRVVAMQLPKAGTGTGFCLNQLQENVFCNTSITRKFDIIQAIKDQAAISHWFEQLSREIMTEKLKAVIQLDNERNLRPSLKTRMDINGNTIADIHWTPNKLYKQIQIEATNTDKNSEYIFKNNEEVWQITQDTVLEDLELGKLVHKKYGFHRFNENLNIGLSLPTDYDDELKRLSIDKPIQAASDTQDRWLFTFFLPFKLTVLILALIVIYIFVVISHAKTNGKELFTGQIKFKDTMGNEIKKKDIKELDYFIIGKGGTHGCGLSDVPWTITINKKSESAWKPCPLYKKPGFVWKKVGNCYVSTPKGSSPIGEGRLGRHGSRKENTRVTLCCGSGKDKITHKIEIILK